MTAKHIFFYSDEPLAHDVQAALERAGYAAVGIARLPDGSGSVVLPHNDNAGPPQPRSGEDQDKREPLARRARTNRDSELDRRFLLRVGEVIHAATDGHDVLATVSQELGRHLGVSRCNFVQIDADGDQVMLHNGYQAGVPEMPATVTLSAFGAETAVASARGETLIIDDARSDQRTAAVFESSYGPAATRSVVSVPLMRDRRWVGGLVVASSTPRSWHEREITLVKLVAERAWLWSEHLRALAELKRTEARFDTFVDDVKEYAIFMLDAEGRIVTWNAGAERITGFAREDVVGQLKAILHPPGDAGRARAILDSAVHGGRYEEEGWRARKDGSRFWARVVVTPTFQRDGSLEGFAVVTRDVTDRRRHEDELRLQQAVLVQSRKEREALTQEVDHRVQNNLQVITSLINMQMRKVPAGDTRDALVRCRNRVLAIAFTQQQLYRAKDYAKVRFDHYLRGLVDQILAATGISLDRVRVELAIDDVPLGIDRAIPCALVLNELVGNALEHGFVGGRRGTIRVELTAVDGGQLRLAVRDDGVGLPAGFDLRTAPSMGLQLVATLAEQLDAELAVTGGNGAAFELTFAALAPAE